MTHTDGIICMYPAMEYHYVHVLIIIIDLENESTIMYLLFSMFTFVSCVPMHTDYILYSMKNLVCVLPKHLFFIACIQFFTGQ